MGKGPTPGRPLPPPRLSTSFGGSHVQANGPHAQVTSGNGAIGYKNRHSADYSIANSATWTNSGLHGLANGTSGALAFTRVFEDDSDRSRDSEAQSYSDAVMENFHYSPKGYANSHFSGMADDPVRAVQSASGNDVSISTGEYAGASTHASAGTADKIPTLHGLYESLWRLGGGALPYSAVDVGVSPLYHGRRLLDAGEEEGFASIPKAKRFAARATAGSHVSSKGFQSSSSSGNGVIAFKANRPSAQLGTDWSLANSASYASSGLFGNADAFSRGDANTETIRQTMDASRGNDTEATSYSEANMVNTNYSPHGTANTHFFSTGRSPYSERPIDFSSGNDVSIASPYFSGGSAGAGAATSGTDPALHGVLQTLQSLGGGYIPVTAINVAAYPHEG
ncbi:hypothetical protein HOP50_08g53440 [Chloropicon primus]|uniref:Uncharacterized protein n=1 Tax=Chloropicon primus TaxID=1764295 RepID=A0A5B8MQP6_9CHLO|nr:hypothetical protein A3770_08p53140 [Chloropicon primus]UPR02020.1 hypothetical protein HOP50_08g53440 [Chloropicon primus]|eukprot:QDZ22796.1 hypothetical protein A3770_08p53140 [Chloropicon primus]